MEKSRAKRPHFDKTVNHQRVEIYPKENLVVAFQAGLHYICQHSFDIIPHDDKQIFYGYKGINEMDVGELIPMKEERMIVKNSDILDGFMLHREQIDEYNDSFVEWIKHRRSLD